MYDTKECRFGISVAPGLVLHACACSERSPLAVGTRRLLTLGWPQRPHPLGYTGKLKAPQDLRSS